MILHLIRAVACPLWCQVSKKYVSKELAKEIHAKAAPFVKWLKEAEEESEGSDEGEEEEEEDENVEVSDKRVAFALHTFSLSSDRQALHLIWLLSCIIAAAQCW